MGNVLEAEKFTRGVLIPARMVMNATHWHLILNHVPVFGSVVGLDLLGMASWRKSQELKRTAFGFLVAVALLSVPVYLTGEPAEDTVKSLPGVSKAIVEQHEEAAAVAFTGVIIVGLAGLTGLAASRGGRLTPAWFVSTTLGASVIVVALVGWTAHLGGQVRHTENRPAWSLSGEGSVGGAAQSKHDDD
jgi:hypothetical protein